MMLLGGIITPAHRGRLARREIHGIADVYAMVAGPEPAGIPQFDVGPDAGLGDFNDADVGDWIYAQDDAGHGPAIHQTDREPRPRHLFVMCACHN